MTADLRIEEFIREKAFGAGQVIVERSNGQLIACNCTSQGRVGGN